ncbi:MAG: NAD(P)/FAD-dependent oxidoreductase, partial [Actinomycetota bacterium]
VELGVTRVTLFEKGPALGQESTARAMGGVRAQFTTPGNIEFSRYSIGQLEALDRTSGGLLSFRQKGYLMFTGSEAAAEELRRARELQRSLGVETEWLAPAEVLERAPFVRPDGLIGGTFHRRDGFLDPHGVVAALGKEARNLGVEMRLRAGIRAIEQTDGGFGLVLDDGVHHANWVVNAAGAWAARVAALAGIELPVEPVRRNLAYVHDPEEKKALIPMCVDVDTGVLCRREEHGGYVLAYSDPDDEPGWDVSVDPKFLEDLAERVGNRFPMLEELPIDPRHCWAGLYPETPDHHAIIGPDERVERFIHCTGFGGHGIMHAPAAGRVVAELIAGREPTLDASDFAPTRFREGRARMETAVF